MNKHQGRIKIVFMKIAFTSYLFAALFGLFPLMQSKAMHMSMRDCPYSMGTQSLCDMSVFEHLSAWRAFSNVIFPTLAIILSFVALALFAFFWPPLFLAIMHPYLWQQRTRHYRLEELFLQTQLNPRGP